MNRKDFIQDKSADFLLKDEIWSLPKDKRIDTAISMAEALWERLKERGYGTTTSKTKDDLRAGKKWTAELVDSERFEEAWGIYHKHSSRRSGDKQAAAKSWIALEESDKQKVIDAIPMYFKSIEGTSTAPKHLSTFINKRTFDGYEKKQKSETKPAYNEKAQEIAALRRQIEMAHESMRPHLQSQLDRLINANR